MNATQFSKTATGVIATAGSTAHKAIDAYRTGGERLNDALAQRWNFPADIIDALAWHHRPALGKPGGLAGIIHYADGIAHALDLDQDGEPPSQMPSLDQDTVSALGLGWDSLNAVLAETRARFDSYETLLG